MVRVFKEDIQKRKEESDRKSGKGGSGTLELSAPELILRFFFVVALARGYSICLLPQLLSAGSGTPFLHTQSI